MARNLLALGSVGAAVRSFAGALSTTEPLLASALILEREIKAQLSRPGMGKAAAPGQPPARQTGKLWASVGHRMLKGRRREKIRIGTTLPQARALEYGSFTHTFRGGRRTIPRPFMRPALKIARPAMIEAFGVKLRTQTRRQRWAAARSAARESLPPGFKGGFEHGGFDF